MIARTLVAQTLYGESQGVGILRKLQSQHSAAIYDTCLSREISRQIDDEISHCRIYGSMLRSLVDHMAQETPRPAVDRSWLEFMTFLGNSDSFTSIVVGIYGLVEPFNKIAVEELLYPNSCPSDQRLIAQVLQEEERHISMFPIFHDLFASKRFKGDINHARKTISLFLKVQENGIVLPNGKQLSLSDSSSRLFRKHIRHLIGLTQAWE